MRCASCQAENPAENRFCEQCGVRLERHCPQCGALLRSGVKFCGTCGQRLTEAEPVATAPVSRPLAAAADQRPATYTPQYLAERILTSKSALEGERKQVTVLFADLKGSMELLADRDPEEARRLLDPVLEHMMEAVHHYEGTVNQVMGDGIMALFGAPIAHEDHAVRACYAALRMQASVKQYAAQAQRAHGVAIQIRVGLNAGEVVVRSIGSDLHMDYTAVGQTTHLAARMEQMAMPGSILITAEVLALTEGYVQVKSLGSVPIKGLREPVEVYELTGAGPVRSRLQAAAARGLTHFVGRERELEALHRALERAQEGHGQVAALVGEPGVGKSRLLYEFVRSHHSRGWLILEGGSVSYGRTTAYLPVIDLLKTYFQLEERDDARRVREKVTGKLVTLDETLRSTLPAFLTLFDVSVDDHAWQALDPPQRRQRTLDAVKRLLLRESQVQPLLLLFEDLHWIDAETQALLDSLVDSLATDRLLLLVAYRPEYQHQWGSRTYCTELRLEPLPAESVEELLQALLGNDTGLERLKALLIERTQGNPFFLEESVRTLVETEALVGERGAYRLARDLQSIQVPATVQAILAARVDRLPLEEKRLLQTAAVIGTDVPFSLLQAIVQQSEETLRLALTHLQAADFLYETSLFPELEYTFRHALTHEVPYRSLLRERRLALHAQIVEVLETLYADRLADQVEQLAYHAVRGEVWEKAVPYLRQGGAKAAAHSAYREAVTCFEQALAALTHLPENRDTCELAIDLRFDLRNVLLPLGEQERAFECLREAETLAEALNDQRRLGRVACYMSLYFWIVGNCDRALESGQRAQALATALGDFSLQVMTNDFLGRAYHSLGDYRRATEILRQNVASLAGELIRERFGLAGLPSVYSRTRLVWCLAELGAFVEGAIRGEEAVRIAEAVDHPQSLISAQFCVGLLAIRKGEFQKAIAALAPGPELCRAWNLPIWFPQIASALGYAYALDGRIDKALPLLEQAVEDGDSMRIMAYHSLWVAWLSEASLLAGRIEEADGLAQRALQLSRDHKERGHQAWVLRLLGEIGSQREPLALAPAEAPYRQALALADEIGMRPLLAHCHVGLGKLYRRVERLDDARVELATATDLFRSMEMTFWLSQAEAALAQA